MALCLFVAQFAVAHYYYGVSLLHLTGGGAVEADFPFAGFSGYHVGGEPLPVGNVVDVYLFVGKYVCELQQLAVYGNAPFVVKVSSGDGSPVNLGLEHYSLHRLRPVGNLQS